MTLLRCNFPLGKVGEDGNEFDCWAYVDDKNNVFCKLKEFAILLGYSNVKMAYKIIPDMWKVTWAKLVSQRDHLETPPNWHPETLFVSEPGIYALIGRSYKPQARKFMQFVYEDVLPSIRKTGAYVSPNIQSNQLKELTNMLQAMEKRIQDMNNDIQSKDRQLEQKDNQIMQLVNRVLEDRPKLAILTNRIPTKHCLCVFKKGNIYKFLRIQKRNLSQAVKRLPDGFDLILERINLPNAVNILNRVKEILPSGSYTSKSNVLITDIDVLVLLENILPQ